MKATFGEYIKQLRTDNGLTLTQLAFQLDLDSANLSKIENGKREFDEKRLEKLATAFDLDIEKLKIEYFALTDLATPINLTNHCYFNLSGDQNADISDHLLRINAKKITITDENLIPTGKFLDVKDTVFDFSTFGIISKGLQSDDESIRKAKGYDHNFILESGDSSKPAAEVIHHFSGRRLLVFTDQPAIQLYTGNWLNNVDGKPGKYRDYTGFCLETQHFPDSPNHAHFPDTILRPGIEFYSKTIYKIDVMA